MTQFETLLNQVYAAWLGKLIGIRLGAPVENWTYEQIRKGIQRMDREK